MIMNEEELIEFIKMSSHIRTVSEEFLTKWYGVRCPNYNFHCECCKRWKALDCILRARNVRTAKQ